MFIDHRIAVALGLYWLRFVFMGVVQWELHVLLLQEIDVVVWQG